MKKLLGILITGFMAMSGFAQKPATPEFTVATKVWPEGLGNHRAVIEVKKPSQAVHIKFLWRRHDANPQENQFIIIDAQNGDTIPNILRKNVSNELCELTFGPVKNSGRYYFYYLPFKVQKGAGFYYGDYLKQEETPDKSWVQQVENQRKIPQAKVIEIQARSSFDSFYPMEIIPTKKEKEKFLKKYPKPFYLFPEDRQYPIRMTDELPLKWVQQKPITVFNGEAARNEYYVFQVGVYADQKNLDNLKVSFSNLTDKSGKEIPASNLTCFNTEGINADGEAFKKHLQVPQRNVQPLWVGVDISKEIIPGNYKGTVTVHPANAPAQELTISLNIADKIIEDRGDSQPWRHSRLRWLNSTLGIDKENVTPYTPIKTTDNRHFQISGRQIELSKNKLPAQLTSGNTPILAAPIQLILEKNHKQLSFGSLEKKQSEIHSGIASYSFQNQAKEAQLNLEVELESDGYLHYHYKIQAKKDLSLSDVRLEIPLKENVAQYMMGMGRPGSAVPQSHQAPWKGPHDSFWFGNAQGGLYCELRGASYCGPLLNLYKPEHPDSWHNQGKGGFKIKKEQGQVKVTAFSGPRTLKKGETIDFEFAFIITPVKPQNTAAQFTNRYYHNGHNPWPSQEEVNSGVKIINVHHGNKYNPYINYPFLAEKEMRHFIDYWHKKERKVKIYYTIRELTNHLPEIWALRSLGKEILRDGPGGGYPWCREHLINNYTPQWYHHFNDEPQLSPDAAILTSTGDSRWCNFYIEGLAWLIKNMDIDGLYLDDVAFDRNMLKRMRKVMERIKPGCMIDLHSNTGFSKGPATQYMEFFPYIDKLWFGESFQYNKMPPENWLVEVSGIPFGLMGDMLHAGGNPWLGMVYGMTVRYPWFTEGVNCDPRSIWKIWDDFDIASAQMVGYWEKNPIITCSDPSVKATVYIHKGKALVAIGNFSDENRNVTLSIDWEKLGIDPEKATFSAPSIKDFQKNSQFKPEDAIPVAPRKGWLFYLK